MHLKIMSFNIRYGSAPDGIHAWPYRKDALLARIRGLYPDLLGVQECRSDGQLADMLAGLPGYDYFGVERGGGSEASPEMAPVFYRSDRFERLDSGAFWLSETPGEPGSLSWGAALPRTLTWVHLAHGGLKIWFGNVHFDHMGAEARLRSAELVAAHLRDRRQDEIKILVGDFNAPKEAPPYRVLTQVLSDPFRPEGKVSPEGKASPEVEVSPEREAASEREGSFHGYGAVRPPEAIDWVLTSPGLRIADAAVDAVSSPHFLSDHYAVVVNAVV